MKLKKYLLFPLLLFVVVSKAQDKAKKYSFHSVNTVSLINGVNSVSAGLQSVNGFQKGNWFAGIGTGLDYYIHRSVPLFADFRYEHGKAKNRFFAYADGGINFAWVRQHQDDVVTFWEGFDYRSDFSNGVYTDAGVGYIMDMKKGGNLLFSLGHSHKSMEQTVTRQDWRTQQPTTDFYKYQLNRIVIKSGWRF